MISADPVTAEAAETDLIDQTIEAVPADTDHESRTDPPVHANPVDVAEQALPVPGERLLKTQHILGSEVANPARLWAAHLLRLPKTQSAAAAAAAGPEGSGGFLKARGKAVDAQRDYYTTLGVPADATTADIQRAYRRLVRHYHPDINHDPDAEREFKQITEAYQVLSDPHQRRRYDIARTRRQQSIPPARARTSRAGTPFPRSPWHEPRLSHTANQTWIGDSLFGTPVIRTDMDPDDVLADHVAHRIRVTRRPDPPRQQVDIEVSVEESYSGTRRTLTVTDAHEQRSTEIVLPAGLIDGQRITLTAQETGFADIGCLELTVHLAPHPRYRLQGRDVHCVLPLSPWEAALGTTVTIDTPGGRARITVRAGTSSGQQLRLRGRGLPNPHGRPGDFYAETRIVVPAKPSDTERELFTKLAATSQFNARQGEATPC